MVLEAIVGPAQMFGTHVLLGQLLRVFIRQPKSVRAFLLEGASRLWNNCFCVGGEELCDLLLWAGGVEPETQPLELWGNGSTT